MFDQRNSGTCRLRVLLADDYGPVIECVISLLQPDFDIVGIANSGTELVDRVVRLRPDIVVADISMPDMTGIEAVHELHARGIHPIVVFLTAYDTPEFVEACQAEGALGFVTKAHIRGALIPAITAALSGQPFVSVPGLRTI
jgi:DNA-binding NarL/FixJ family response regulator